MYLPGAKFHPTSVKFPPLNQTKNEGNVKLITELDHGNIFKLNPRNAPFQTEDAMKARPPGLVLSNGELAQMIQNK